MSTMGIKPFRFLSILLAFHSFCTAYSRINDPTLAVKAPRFQNPSGSRACSGIGRRSAAAMAAALMGRSRLSRLGAVRAEEGLFLGAFSSEAAGAFWAVRHLDFGLS